MHGTDNGDKSPSPHRSPSHTVRIINPFDPLNWYVAEQEHPHHEAEGSDPSPLNSRGLCTCTVLGAVSEFSRPAREGS